MKCPKCDGPMVMRRFAETFTHPGPGVFVPQFDADASEDPFCPNCAVRWSALSVNVSTLATETQLMDDPRPSW